jgi:CheY-like chemotaxis protein
LTGILGLSEALQLNTFGKLNSQQQKTLATIEASGRHLLDLINDILDLSKIEAGKLELQFALFSIADVCQASLQLTKGMAHQKNQKVCYTPGTEPVLVRADVRRLKQILVNLLGNAIKFTPENGELGLDIQTNKFEKTVTLTVWDKGIGIEVENLPKLFKPFVQLDSSLGRQYPGTGLGLSLAQRLTEMHSGHIDVESVFGEGSRFIVTLPWLPQASLINSSEQTFGMRGPFRPVISPQTPKSPLVIIADDNETVLQMVADFLETKQYRVLKVRSGIELLERVTEVYPDILLVDIQMPEMDGLETIRSIRAHADPLIAVLPVIAITALAMPGDCELCLQAGANEYMSKPLKLLELVAAIQKLIEDKP